MHSVNLTLMQLCRLIVIDSNKDNIIYEIY